MMVPPFGRGSVSATLQAGASADPESARNGLAKTASNAVGALSLIDSNRRTVERSRRVHGPAVGLSGGPSRESPRQTPDSPQVTTAAG